MAESVTLVAQARENRGTHEARRMRKGGKNPAVVYGHKEATITVAVSRDDLHKAIRGGARVVDLQAGGKTEKALIRDVQWDHLGLDIMHVDFARVAAVTQCAIHHQFARLRCQHFQNLSDHDGPVHPGRRFARSQHFGNCFGIALRIVFLIFVFESARVLSRIPLPPPVRRCRWRIVFRC